MTYLKPTLSVRRLIVLQGGHRAFDCTFHDGVNIIRGRNSSGKTTIMDLLAYSLGAENIRWKPEALMCSATMVEVHLNGVAATLLRDIEPESQRPLNIFWGSIEVALVAGVNHWERYPFRRSEQKISFSQALFSALEIPQAQGAAASNLTMHQLLRVLYADQPSVHSPIFRTDNFDSALTRDMVGGYLCGVSDDDLYSAQLEVREVGKSLDKIIGELRGIFNVLGRSGQTPDIEASRSVIPALEAERGRLTEYIVGLKAERSLSKKEANTASAKVDGIRSKLNSAKQYEAILKDGLLKLNLEIADSKLFLKELEERLSGLDDSKETRNYFGALSFLFCPSCLTELTPQASEGHDCHLCKHELTEGASSSNILRMRNELSIQIKESSLLLKAKEEEATKLSRDIPLATEAAKRLEAEYSSISSHWSSNIETLLEDSARRLGSLDEEIKQAYENQKLFTVISELQKNRNELTFKVEKLNDLINNLERKQEARKREVSSKLSSNMIELLKKDLQLQPEFIDANTVEFSFIDNTVLVNGSRNFSESSAVVLRHVFHLALLKTSAELSYMRVPRFMMLDGIDDGGMEKERSHNLQALIVSECEKISVPFQVIYATSEINPDLQNGELVVGRYFNPESRSLNVSTQLFSA